MNMDKNTEMDHISAHMLSPRSKVAKMLADIDNAPTPSPPAKTAAPTASSADSNKANGADSLSPPLVHDHKLQLSSHSYMGRAAKRMRDQQHESPSRQRQHPGMLPSSPPVPLGPQAFPADGDDLYSATPAARRPSHPFTNFSPIRSELGGALFVSPAKSIGSTDDDSDDLPEAPLAFDRKGRLAELIAQKRQDRLQHEAETQKQREREKGDVKSRKRRRSISPPTSLHRPGGGLEGSQHDANSEIERIMSDTARPTRKASKKALLEIERETQRLARQQALAHQMKVKKKFTTADLLARFNVRHEDRVQDYTAAPMTEGNSTAVSSAQNSDAVEPSQKDPASTPPSSPPNAGPTPLEKQKAIVEIGALSKLVQMREDRIADLAKMNDVDEDVLPDIAKMVRPTQHQESAGAGAGHGLTRLNERATASVKVARLPPEVVSALQMDESDDGLEIIAPLPKHLNVFNKVKPQAKAKAANIAAIHNLKHLSHVGAYGSSLTRPSKSMNRLSIGPRALEAMLRRRAKEQARLQQQERIEELKAKGIIIQTADELEKEQEVFENLLEKARAEAAQLRKAEKAAAKEAGNTDLAPEVSEDEDEEEEYVDSGSEEEIASQDGGSEDAIHQAAAETKDDADSPDDESEVTQDDMLEHEVDADAEGDASETDDGDSRDTLPNVPVMRRSRQSRIVRDDDEEIINDNSATAYAKADAPAATQKTDNTDDPFAAFGFGGQGGSDNMLMSPTQAFQATMQTPTQATQRDSLDILRQIAPSSLSIMPPSLPKFDDETRETERHQDQDPTVSASQVPESQRMNLAWETQPPETPSLPPLHRAPSGLTETPGWEPTQDPGLPSPGSGLRRARSIVASMEQFETQSTVALRVSESPIKIASATRAPRRGRLIRRQAAMLAESSDEDEAAASAKPARINAFREMARRRREALTATERAEAEKEIKEMLEEQAEESEDEYAGLGGDDFVAPETEQDREMIDTSNIEVNEMELAQLFAEKERQRQEEETSRLYKDLTTGALRRKNANLWDLEEDEDDLAMRRRQLRQREEARKRKLLLQDDHIAGLAEGKQSKGKDAFLKAIADDDVEDVLDLTDGTEDDSVAGLPTDGQEASQRFVATLPLQEVSGNKRRLEESEKKPAERASAKQRRPMTSAFRKPTSLHEVKESVSFLLDEPDVALMGSTVELGSESDGDAEHYGSETSGEEEDLVEVERARHNDGGYAANPADFDARAMPPPRLPASQRRTAMPAKAAVVDRLSLKRGLSAPFDSASNHTAWAAPPSVGAFKTPSLLRRATSNLSSAAANDRGVTHGPSALNRESSGVRMGGSKKSSLAYQARAEERRAIVEASARRREESTAKIAQMRRNSSLLGRGLTGRFE